MKTSLIHTLSFVSFVALAACTGENNFPDVTGDTTSPADTMSSDVATADVTDTGTVIDSGAMDAGAIDSGTTDSGGPADASDDADAGVVDSGDTDSGSTCPPTGTGASCGDTMPCVGGFTCDLGRCIPQGRATCGGFANTPCREAPYTECLFENGHGDVGTCFSTAERACLCAEAADQWQCH